MLIGVIYFFYFGLMGTSKRASDRMDLTRDIEVAMEYLTTDLRSAYSVESLLPDSIRLRCLDRSRDLRPEDVNDRANFTTIEYRIRTEGEVTRLVRIEGLRNERNLVNAREIDPAIFTGLVYQLPEKKEDPIPSFKAFNTVAQPESDKAAITLVRIRLAVRAGDQRMEVVTKVFLGVVANALQETGWNQG